MKTKHTPGPWRFSGETTSLFGHVKIGTHELIINTPSESRERIANAKLIAAAPDLLEALKLAYDLLEEHQGEAKWYLRGHYNKINAAIKKATE